jgi:hypothetical protein
MMHTKNVYINDHMEIDTQEHYLIPNAYPPFIIHFAYTRGLIVILCACDASVSKLAVAYLVSLLKTRCLKALLWHFQRYSSCGFR